LSELLKGIVPIEKKFLQLNQSFAIEFREGFLFGRVVRRRICNWKPWYLIDSDGNNIDITALSHQAELRFLDPRNPVNDILYLDTTTNSGRPWLLHGAIGIKPQYVYAYLRYPEGDIIPGKFPNVDPIRPAAGDPISPLNGLVSPYEQPTDSHEIIIQPGVHLAAEYYNVDEKRNHQPVMNLLFCLYWVQWFQPNTHPTLISDIALKRYEGARAEFLQAGFGDYPHDLGPGLIKDWSVTPMSLDEAAALGGR
jgi:hypothetical protein